MNYFDYLKIHYYSSFDEAYSYSRVDRQLFNCKINIKNIKLFKSELDINDKGYKVYIISDQWNGTCEFDYQSDCLCLELKKNDSQLKLSIGMF